MRIISMMMVATAALAVAQPALAADEATVVALTIQNHQFTPASVEVPAGKPLKLVIENKDNSPEEFESHALKAEKIIPANGKVTIKVKALKAGSYAFVGEFHEDTAKGTLVAK